MDNSLKIYLQNRADAQPKLEALADQVGAKNSRGNPTIGALLGKLSGALSKDDSSVSIVLKDMLEMIENEGNFAAMTKVYALIREDLRQPVDDHQMSAVLGLDVSPNEAIRNAFNLGGRAAVVRLLSLWVAKLLEDK